MKAGLYSRCIHGNSTVIAMAKWPKESNMFPARHSSSAGRELRDEPAPGDRATCRAGTTKETSLPSVGAVTVPTLMAQLKRHFRTSIGNRTAKRFFSVLRGAGQGVALDQEIRPVVLRLAGRPCTAANPAPRRGRRSGRPCALGRQGLRTWHSQALPSRSILVFGEPSLMMEGNTRDGERCRCV